MTTESKPWTPGPWFPELGQCNNTVGVWHEQGIRHIATVDVAGDVDEGNANARLIAASPELADLLEKDAEYLETLRDTIERGLRPDAADMITLRNIVNESRALLDRIKKG